MRERLAEHAPTLRRDASVHISRRDADLLVDLERIGLHVSSIALAGEPRRALRRLRRSYGELEWVGVDCRPLETRRQVSAIAALLREEFSRNPQFGDFVPSRRFLSAHSTVLRGEIECASGNQWVLVHGSKVVGHFGFSYIPRSSFGQPIGAFGVTLHRDVQGMGLAKVAYATMLERMVKLGIRMVLGMTSQPPVMHLSAIMGRSLFGYELRAGRAWFPREHFCYPRGYPRTRLTPAVRRAST
jgi:hypothetical protein